MIEFLENTVRIKSPSGDERDVSAYLARAMTVFGFDRAFVDDAENAVGIIGSGSRQLVFLGHIDTVEGDVPVRYDDDALGRKLYGRGTVDAKGPLCAFILAARQLVGRTGDWQIVVIGATGEESAYAKGARFAITQYHPNLCIIGEPSGTGAVTLGYKGRLLAEVHMEQASQHTARPGPNPSEYAVKLWNSIHTVSELYNGVKRDAFDLLMPKLRDIQAGDDGLREWCDMRMGFRLPLEITPQQLQQRILAEFETLKQISTLDKLASSISFRGNEPAVRADRNTPLVYAFLDAIRAEKLRPSLKLKTGTSDWNVVAPYWKCPTLAYGPGDSNLDHTPIEHVYVHEFERAVRVLTRVVESIVSGR